MGRDGVVVWCGVMWCGGMWWGKGGEGQVSREEGWIKISRSYLDEDQANLPNKNKIKNNNNNNCRKRIYIYV